MLISLMCSLLEFLLPLQENGKNILMKQKKLFDQIFLNLMNFELFCQMNQDKQCSDNNIISLHRKISDIWELKVSTELCDVEFDLFFR
jgi:hypothetical protein